MYLLGVDAGTTHCKAGLFTAEGRAVRVASRPTITRRAADGRSFFDPGELWATVAAVIAEAVAAVENPDQIAATGLTSMAESGLLVDRASGLPRSEIHPWFDQASNPQAVVIERESVSKERFQRTGLRPSFKFGLSKLLWLREHAPDAHRDAVWLSVSDYIAFRLTGRMATDYSLAARTYAFRIDTQSWDAEWIHFWGFDPALFPDALPSGTPIGRVSAEGSAATSLPGGIPVAIGGHDHLCAAVAVGAHRSGVLFDSMGTAESLLGTLPQNQLSEVEYSSGLSFGRHVAGGRYYWQGGLASSGGSIEWLRRQLGEQPLDYDRLQALLSTCANDPTGILYFPYLSGSGTPWTNAAARAAFVGLRASHTRSDLLKAVLEGTAYEVEAIRRAGEQVSGVSSEQIVAVGGGTRLRQWMQIKSDVSGCRYDIVALEEAAVLGAAVMAGAGCGLYSGVDEAVAALSRQETTSIRPDMARHHVYQGLYERGYLALQAPLREYYRQSPARR